MVSMISVSPAQPHPKQHPLLFREAVVQNRCARNRKRSKRRAIFCPEHHCYLDSVSQKYPLFAEKTEQLRARGVGRKAALMLIATRTAVPLQGEWIESFWCPQCAEANWYHIHKLDNGQYSAALVPKELWSQVSGIIHPRGNPSVSQFSRRQARMVNFGGYKDFRFSG